MYITIGMKVNKTGTEQKKIAIKLTFPTQNIAIGFEEKRLFCQKLA
jgi:hypothetical protein